MNPFLSGFNAPRLIEYIQRLQGSISDKKNSPESRAKFKDELVEAHDALRVILQKMLAPQRDVSIWRAQGGLKVKIVSSRGDGFIQEAPVVPDKDDHVAVRQIVMDSNNIPISGKLVTYFPEELEIVLPVRLWEIPH